MNNDEMNLAVDTMLQLLADRRNDLEQQYSSGWLPYETYIERRDFLDTYHRIWTAKRPRDKVQL